MPYRCTTCKDHRDPWFVCPDCHDGRLMDTTCPACGGSGSITTPCPACLGTGKDEDEPEFGCRNCHGAPWVAVCWACQGAGAVAVSQKEGG